MMMGPTDRQTDGRQTVTLCIPLDAASIISEERESQRQLANQGLPDIMAIRMVCVIGQIVII